jgi:hypothetical protein
VRAWLLTIPLLFACAMMAGLAGCGGGQNSSGAGTGTTRVAPGSYSIHVSATGGSVTTTQTLSLTVE